MKSIYVRILLILSLISNGAISQSLQVDSVVIRHCFYESYVSSHYGMQIDSFYNGGLIYNSSFLDSAGNILGDQTVYSYSATNMLVHKTFSQLYNSVRRITNEEIYQYNAGDSLTLQTMLRYSYSGSTQYTYGYGYRHNYNPALLQDTIINLDYNTSTQVFDDNGMNLMIYDQSGKLARIDHYYPYNSTTHTLELTNWYAYLPNDSLNFILRKDYTTSSSFDSSIYKYNYDASNYLLSIVNNNWDPADTAFTWDNYLTKYYYDASHNLLARTVNWYFHPAGWELEDSTWYSYDGQNRLIDGGSYSYPHGGSSTHITYDPLSNYTDSLNQCVWGTSTRDCSSCKLEYHSIPVGVSENSELKNFTVFPNPSEGRIQILLPQTDQKTISISITDIQSKVLYIKNIEPTSAIITLDDLNFSSGFYFITLSKIGSSSTKKLIIQ